jgi:hypothetical protein
MSEAKLAIFAGLRRDGSPGADRSRNLARRAAVTKLGSIPQVPRQVVKRLAKTVTPQFGIGVVPLLQRRERSM